MDLTGEHRHAPGPTWTTWSNKTWKRCTGSTPSWCWPWPRPNSSGPSSSSTTSRTARCAGRPARGAGKAAGETLAPRAERTRKQRGGRGMNRRQVNPWVALAALCVGFLHDPAGHHDRQRGDSGHDQGIERQPQRDRLGDQRLPAGLCRAAAGCRPTRRPDRPQDHVRRRPRRVHRGVAVVRAVRQRRDADRRPGRAGTRRRRADSADDGLHHQPVPAGEARHAAGHLGWGRRSGHHRRTAAWRRAGGQLRLAVDLHGQRADRRCRRGRGADPVARQAAQPQPALRPGRHRPVRTRPFRAGVRRAERPAGQLGQGDRPDHHPGTDRRRHRPAGRFRVVASDRRAARQRTADAAGIVPLQQLRRSERRPTSPSASR